MKDYIIAIIRGKSVEGWEFGEEAGKSQILWNSTMKFKINNNNNQNNNIEKECGVLAIKSC